MVPLTGPVKGVDSLIGEAGTITAAHKSLVSSVLLQETTPVVIATNKNKIYFFIFLNYNMIKVCSECQINK